MGVSGSQRRSHWDNVRGCRAEDGWIATLSSVCRNAAADGARWLGVK